MELAQIRASETKMLLFRLRCVDYFCRLFISPLNPTRVQIGPIKSESRGAALTLVGLAFHRKYTQSSLRIGIGQAF